MTQENGYWEVSTLTGQFLGKLSADQYRSCKQAIWRSPLNYLAQGWNLVWTGLLVLSRTMAITPVLYFWLLTAMICVEKRAIDTLRVEDLVQPGMLSLSVIVCLISVVLSSWEAGRLPGFYDCFEGNLTHRLAEYIPELHYCEGYQLKWQRQSGQSV